MTCHSLSSSSSSSSSSSTSSEGENNQKDGKRIRNALQAIVAVITIQILFKDKLYNAVTNAIPGDGLCDQKSFLDLKKEVQQVRVAFSDLTSKHKSLACELQEHRDREASNKAQLKYLEGPVCLSNGRTQLSSRRKENILKQLFIVQLEEENLAWREKEMLMKMKIEWLDFNHRSAAIANARISELEKEMQKCGIEKTQMEAKLEDALREPGRKEVCTEFKTLLSSFPEERSRMLSQLSSYKETAKDIHALRAEVKSLSGILEQKVRDMDKLSTRSTGHVSDAQRLQVTINDLKESDEELKLILRMFNRQSVTSSLQKICSKTM